MTDTIGGRDALVEAITREVLAALGSSGGATTDPCDTCEASCASHCSTTVLSLIHISEPTRPTT